MLQKHRKTLVIVSIVILAGAVIYVSRDRLLVMLVQAVFSTADKVEVDALAEYCGGIGSLVVVDSVFRNDKGTLVPREFNTEGGELLVSIKDIPMEGVFDFGTHAQLAIGPSEKTWKMVSNAVYAEKLAREDQYYPVTLDPGTYWLWVSNGGNVEIVSCEPENLSLVTYEE